jgi:hypothetical protein
MSTITRSRAAVRILTVVAALVGAATLVLPATASAEAWVSNPGNGQDCGAWLAGKVYSGTGTDVVTPKGRVSLTCHLTLVSGTAVDRPTTTTMGNCELLETPTGEARLSCHYLI